MKRKILAIMIAAVVACTGFAACGPTPPLGIIDAVSEPTGRLGGDILGGNKETFLFENRIEETDAVRRVDPIEEASVVATLAAGAYGLYFEAAKTGYRLAYNVDAEGKTEWYAATSTDGRSFDAPVLIARSERYRGFVPIAFDGYDAVAVDRTDGHVRALKRNASGEVSETRTICAEEGIESIDNLLYDEATRTYYCWVRTESGETLVATSSDFVTWKRPKQIRSYEEYETKTAIMRADASVPEALSVSRRTVNGVSDFVLTASEDGFEFRTVGTILSPGTENDALWGKRDVEVVHGLLPLYETHAIDPYTEWGLYTVERKEGTATLTLHRFRRDGFVAYYGGYESPKLVTTPVHFDRGANALTLNYRTGGWKADLIVDFLDADGTVLGTWDVLRGNRTEKQALLPAAVSEAGYAILRFTFTDAYLYSYRFERRNG